MSEEAAKILEAVARALPAHVERLAGALIERALGPIIEHVAQLTAELAAVREEAAGCVRRSSIEATLEELRQTIATTLTAVVAEARGAPGEQGERGAPGRDGRDATLTPPIPYVAGRVYARGSLVIHRGGVWYANADSEVEPGAAHSGFSLVLDAVTPTRIAPDAHGFLQLELEHASGLTRTLPLGYRPLTYQGVWECECDYELNDAATINGSLYIARQFSRGMRPGIAESEGYWTLAVKAGKPARPPNGGGGHG